MRNSVNHRGTEKTECQTACLRGRAGLGLHQLHRELGLDEVLPGFSSTAGHLAAFATSAGIRRPSIGFLAALLQRHSQLGLHHSVAAHQP